MDGAEDHHVKQNTLAQKVSHIFLSYAESTFFIKEGHKCK
jgi:hypothetical protein